MERNSLCKEDLVAAAVWLAWAITAPLVVFSLGACTTIGHEKVEGWPNLKVTEHRVPHHEMRDRCAKYAPWGSYPEACAEFNLNAGTCDIWLSADFPPPAAFVEHERLHCHGYDHVGEENMSRLLAVHKLTAPRAEVLP